VDCKNAQSTVMLLKVTVLQKLSADLGSVPSNKTIFVPKLFQKVSLLSSMQANT